MSGTTRSRGERFRHHVPAELTRPRLLTAFEDLVSSGLAIVSAPAGAGKTTLLRQVAKSSDLPVAWYHAGEDEFDEPSFVARLGASLAEALDVPAAARAGRVSDLLAAVETVDTPVLVVMDDLHDLAGTEAERALERFAHRRPPGWRLVLGCRRPPLRDLPSLRLSGEVLELSGDDLRFRSWEVEELFDAVYRSPLPPEAVAALTRRTGGWAAGLALFHLATARMTAPERHRAVDQLAGGSRLVRSYLAHNVLNELDADRRRFLTRTCALGTLTGPLCDELLDTTQSLRVLEQLAEEQLFTLSADDGLTFSYHHVLQSHLEVALVQELGPPAARAWYGRCAALLERRGYERDALRAYTRSEDWASTARLVQRTHRAPDRSPATALPQLLPPGLRDRDPWFASADSRRRLRQGDLAGAAAALRRAEQLSDERSFREDRRLERVLVESWHELGPPLRASDPGGRPRHWTQRLRAAVHSAPDAVPGALPDSPVALDDPGDRLAAAASALLAGDARRTLRLLEPFPAADPDLGACGELLAAVAELVAHGLPGPVDRLEAVLLRADLEDHPWLARQARAVLDAATGRGPAPDGPDPLLEECDRDGDRWGAALLRLSRGAPIALGVRDAERGAAEHWLADAVQRFRQLEAPVLVAWAQALLAVHLVRRDAAGAETAATRAELAARRAKVPAAGALVRGGRAASRVGTAPGAAPGPVVRGSGAPSPGHGARPVRLTCLGGFGLRVGADEVDLTGVRRRARTVLRYLALHQGTDVHRERLIHELWPNVEVPAGTRNLQVAISSLRGALEAAGLDGTDVLCRSGDAYRLQLPPGATSDLGELSQALAAARTARAGGDLPAAVRAGCEIVALYRGELFPEDRSADWADAERERWRLQAAGAAADLAEDQRALGRLGEAVGAARRSVQLDPLSDGPWRQLTELYEELGNPVAAALARREYERVRQELGVPLPRPGPAAVPARSAPAGRR